MIERLPRCRYRLLGPSLLQCSEELRSPYGASIFRLQQLIGTFLLHRFLCFYDPSLLDPLLICPFLSFLFGFFDIIWFFQCVEPKKDLDFEVGDVSCLERQIEVGYRVPSIVVCRR